MKLTFFTALFLAVASVALAVPPTPPSGGGGTAATVTAVDEFTNSDALNVQDVLDDLDGAIAGGATTLVDAVATPPLLVNGGAAVNDSFPGADADLTFSLPAASTGVAGYMTSDQEAALAAIDTEAELEALLELQDLQGAVTDAQVPDDITVDSATAAGTAAVGTAVTITDNENTNETNAIIFSSGGDLDGGNIGLESDGDFYYQPNLGLLSVGGPLQAGGGISGATITLGTTAPRVILNDTDGADGIITLDATDVDDAVLALGVDDSNGDDQTYIEVDGVNEDVEIKYPLIMEAGGSVSDGQVLDLSGITQTADVDEGIRLPVWENVTYSGVAEGLFAYDPVTDVLKYLASAGWQSIGSSGAPADATYLVLDHDAGDLTVERVLTAGEGIDFTDGGAGSTLTVAAETGAEGNLGVLLLATTADVVTGTDTAKAVTAAGVTARLEAPGAIGGTTPAAGAFTTVTGSGAVTAGTSFVIGSADVDETELEILDGAVVTTTQLNYVDLTSSGQTQIDAKAGIADAEAISGVWEVQDDTLLNFGADADFGIRYDETTDDQLEIVSNSATDTTIDISNAGAGDTNLVIDGDITYNGSITYGGSGDSYIGLSNNASITGSGYQVFFEGGDLTSVENGTEKILLNEADGATLTGTSWNFAGVTNFTLPTAAADASGEMSISTGDQLKWHDGTKVVTIDTTTTTDNYVLKYDNASATFNLEADATGGTPAWSDVTDPTADVTIDHDAAEETAFTFTGNYTTGSQFLVQQATGNPTGGVLFEVQGADSDSTVMEVGDGTNVWTVSTAGLLANAGTATINLAAASDLLVGGGQIDFDDMAGSAANVIDSDQYVDGSIDLAHMSVNSVDSDQYVDASIDLAHMSVESVDSDQYVDASIDNAHLADDAVGTDEIANDLNIVTTGTIQGDINVVNKSTATTISAAEMNSMIFVSAAVTSTLPAVSIGTSVCFYSTGANAVVVDANASDRIRLDGTALADGDSITSASGAGDFICLIGDSADGWTTLGRNGTWTDTN